MIKNIGIHFYINIVNYNQIILDEEKRYNDVTRSIHALDTFFSSIESYGKRLSALFVVEKITGSRLHMYVKDELVPAYQIVKKVSAYAFKLSRAINIDIPKYKNLMDFFINIGVAYGKFYEFEFITEEGYSELTTIGYSANYAAKLQALASNNKICISEDVYLSLPENERKNYEMIFEASIKKYGQDKCYIAPLSYLLNSIIVETRDIEAAKEYAYSNNLGDINYSEAYSPIDFGSLSKTKCKKLTGIPIYADVRDFTQQFHEDDSNLDEMARKTQKILESMYRICCNNGGIHVQFQGDRELSLFHNVHSHMDNGRTIPEKSCIKSAVLASMRLIDAVGPYSVHIGIGEDFGQLFATKIGARGEKDNILLGDTVIQADILEDRYAGKDQIAISMEVYEGLRKEDASLASQFSKAEKYYITTIGYNEYLQNTSFQQLKKNTSLGNYNGAWGA